MGENEDGVVGEDEFVCECCDPKKKVRSEEVSDVEEEDNDETDGLLSDSDEDVEDSPCQSREDSPVVNGSRGSGNVTKNGNCNVESPTKPMAPGWFGKGKRRRGKLK